MALAPDSVHFISQQFINDLRKYNDILALVGIFYLGQFVLKCSWTLFRGLRTHAVSKFRSLNLRENYGTWAVVTGCTDGIGRAYALEFAHQGLNLVLISRNMTKLRELSEIIVEKHNVETLLIEADFSHGPGVYHNINEQLIDLDIGILVNNVGVISNRPMYVSEMTEHNIWEHINVNVAPVTIMTRMVIPRMITKKKGAIINLSSLSAIAPIPLLAVYSATKVYVDYFSQALECEVKGTGIVVQTLMPSYVKTQMVSYSPLLKGRNPLVPTPEVFVKHALSTLGTSNRTTGYWLHGIQRWVLSCFPTNWIISSAFLLNRYFRRAAITARDK